MCKRAILIIPAVLISLLIAGCAKGGGLQADTGGGSNGTLLLNMGDSLPDQVLALEFTVNNATLSGSTNPVIISTPTKVEFIRNAAKFETVAIPNLPAGTYTAITFTLSAPVTTIADPVSHTIVPVATLLTNATVPISLGSGVVVGSTPVTLNLELNTASSLLISGTSATLTPAFTVSTANVGATQDDSSGEFDNIKGRITTLGSSSITIQPSNSAQPFTFATNASTQFKNGTTALSVGGIVTIEGVTQSDGSLLARQVEGETVGGSGSEVEGIITAITGNPATSFSLTAESNIASNAANAPVTGSTVLATPSASVQYSTESATISGTLP
ncbi:MAG TPA: DUF5666 domain-containing protein, partial [Candidatus Limnocylindrales bacterium]|nr:DUF5666 domain-containing protein [Candidatus Limnocylindrales bacterium]